MSIENPERRTYADPEVKAKQMYVGLVFNDEQELRALKRIYELGHTFRIVLTKDEVYIGGGKIHDYIARQAGVEEANYESCYYQSAEKELQYKLTYRQAQTAEMLGLHFRDLEAFSIKVQKRIAKLLETNFDRRF